MTVANSLTLEVAGPEARRLGNAACKVFSASGGTIGRLPDNSWVLPDQHISGRHAVIRYSNGTYYVVDTSSNGVFFNSPDARLQKNQPQVLKHGDRLYMDTYEIRVSIRTDARSEAALEPSFGDPGPLGAPAGGYIPDDPFAEETADDFVGQTATPLPVQPAPSLRPRAFPAHNVPLPGFAPLPDGEVDPMRLLGLNAPPPPPQVPKAEDLLRGSPLSNAYRPPPVHIPETPPFSIPTSSDADSLIPTGYNPLAEDAQVEVVAVAKVVSTATVVATATTLESTPARAHTSGADFAALLAAAGIDNAAVTPEVIESFGRILRIVVSGTMDLLRVREGVKDEFRMRMTTFKAADNNPLKFSANVEDALHNLLVKRNAAYLPPVDAFRDAFQDARNHQVAMFEGLRAAFTAMLSEFDPQGLEEKFDKQAKGSLLSSRRKHWELYKDWYDSVAQDADSAFRTLFGEEFARAYEEQMQRLKNSAR
jgi:type VI secretion system protein ImpI